MNPNRRLTSRSVEWSVHPPTDYILRYWSTLLPAWTEPVGSVLVLLQQAPLPLVGQSACVSFAKAQLRDRALSLGTGVAIALRHQGYPTALFDPKTGCPVAYPQGKPLNDVAVAQQLLGYSAARDGRCTCLNHPQWGVAVYPTTLLSTALPQEIDLQWLQTMGSDS
ncbi:MAG: hypothetical protein WBA10_20330 [Elainellaceae cyanobacterium]